jgi:hypothetical protein
MPERGHRGAFSQLNFVHQMLTANTGAAHGNRNAWHHHFFLIAKHACTVGPGRFLFLRSNVPESLPNRFPVKFRQKTPGKATQRPDVPPSPHRYSKLLYTTWSEAAVGRWPLIARNATAINAIITRTGKRAKPLRRERIDTLLTVG